MRMRKKMRRSTSKKVFRKGAVRVHKKNRRGRPMRGGIRA